MTESGSTQKEREKEIAHLLPHLGHLIDSLNEDLNRYLELTKPLRSDSQPSAEAQDKRSQRMTEVGEVLQTHVDKISAMSMTVNEAIQTLEL